MGLTVKLFGQFELHDGAGRKLELPTRKVRALLSYLTVNADRPHPRERLMELLWGDRADRQARQSLNHALRAIRKIGEDEGIAILDTDGEFVTLNGDAVSSDIARFRELLDTDPRQAAANCTGTFLDGFSLSEPAFDDWLSMTRAEFLRLSCNALEAGAKAAEPTEAIELTRRLLALDPLREDAHRTLIQLLYQTGDRTTALRQYQACAEILKRELQVEPDAATRALYEQVRTISAPAADVEPPADQELPCPPDDTEEDRDLNPPLRAADEAGVDPQSIPRQGPFSLIGDSNARYAGLVIVALAIVGIISIWLISTRDAGSPAEPQAPVTARSGNPSVAILPFANLSDDKEQEYFSDGLTEDLLTDLSKITALRVISRSTMFSYKGKTFDSRLIAKDLGVSHVVEGSVRKAGNRVRITAQLIDADNGTMIWAERYDRDLKDIFDLQDDVRSKIIQSLSVNLAPDETTRIGAKGTKSPEAYDYYLRGRHQENSFTQSGINAAITSYERAIELDPRYANSYARLANMYDFKVRFGWSDNVERDRRTALESSRKAVELSPDNPYAHWTRGRIQSRLGSGGSNDQLQAIESLRRAIELDGNYGDAYAFISLVYLGIGNIEEASKTIKKAFELNPQAPFWYIQNRAIINYMLDDYEAAINDLNTAAEINPTAVFVHWWLAAAYAQNGQLDDAAWAVEEINTLGQSPTVSQLVESASILHFPPYKERFADGLRRAGIPE